MVSETSSYHGYPICRLVGPSIERALGEYDRKRGHESSFVESLCTFEVTPSPPTPLLPPPPPAWQQERCATCGTGARGERHSTHLPSQGNVLNTRHAILYFSLELHLNIVLPIIPFLNLLNLETHWFNSSESLLRVVFTSNCYVLSPDIMRSFQKKNLM